jgi:hypothetical protein
MRDLEVIDNELRLLAAVRRVCREQDGVLPSIGPIDEPLDERRELDRKLTRRLREQVAGSRLRAAVCGVVLGQQRTQRRERARCATACRAVFSFLMSSRLWAFAKATRSAWTFFNSAFTF